MEIKNLYRQIIMDHYKNPKNKGLVGDSSYVLLNMTNPSCGDNVFLQLKMNEDIIEDIKHDGTGCSICCSASSVLSVVLKGKTKKEGIKMLDAYHGMITGSEYDETLLKNELVAYEGVAKFPARVRCATLASRALEKGLLNKENEKNEW